MNDGFTMINWSDTVATVSFKVLIACASMSDSHLAIAFELGCLSVTIWTHSPASTDLSQQL